MSTRFVPLVIVGAGIAGLAASRRATELDLDHVVLEAKERIGGRIHTVTRTDGTIWDRGSHRLRQPPINPLVSETVQHGLVLRKPWRQHGGVWLAHDWLPEFRADEIWHQIDECEDLARELDKSGEDAPITELVDPEFPDADALAAVLRHTYGEDPERISAVDLGRFGPFEGAWPIETGFGALIQAIYSDIPVELNTPVRVIDWGADPVRVDLGAGLIETDRVLLTVSTAVLVNGEIVIAPALPDGVQAAITGLPLGSLNHVVFDIDDIGAVAEPDSTVYSIRNGGSVCFSTPPVGQRGIVGTVAGELSRDLEMAGPDEMINLVFEHALALFGSDASPDASAAESTAWGLEPYIRGAVSIAMPDASDARMVLAEPIQDRLFFAGEALSQRSFGTVHGAIQTGIDAVNRIGLAVGLLTDVPKSGDNPDIYAFDL